MVERGLDGWWVAHCPALKSCWSQGRTRAKARRNLCEAVALYVAADGEALS